MAGLVLVAVLLVPGCSSKTWTPPAVCQDSDSLIMQVFPDPPAAGVILQVANYQLLQSNVYAAADALAVIEAIEILVAEGTTWRDLVGYVLQRIPRVNDKYGVAILLASSALDVLNQDLPLSDCDKLLVRAHLGEQRKIIQQVLATTGG